MVIVAITQDDITKHNVVCVNPLCFIIKDKGFSLPNLLKGVSISGNKDPKTTNNNTVTCIFLNNNIYKVNPIQTWVNPKKTIPSYTIDYIIDYPIDIQFIHNIIGSLLCMYND